MKRVIFCALRDNKGATGGPGGVLFMLQQSIKNSITGVNCQYLFNTTKYGKKFKSKINKTLFFLRELTRRDAYYIAHEIDSAYILAKLGKKYSLVYHNQGPIIQEQINFGGSIKEKTRKKISLKERLAFTKAISVHFPSYGASNMYFNNEFASCSQSDVNLGRPLYNTIPKENHRTEVDKIKKEKETITFFSLGTLTKAKGQDLSLELLDTYMKYQTKKVRYIVVGSGILQSLVLNKGKELAQKYTNFSFHYFERLDHSQVMYLHEITDFYVMNHRLSIFDFATLEAMSKSSAIILSNIGGNLDFNKDNNIIYVKENIEESAQEIINADIETLKRKNKIVFDKYFSNDAFINEYKQLIIDNK